MALIQTQRKLFDIPEDIAYFNCAYYSPQLNESHKRLQIGVTSKNHPWERTPSNFFEDSEAIRQLASGIFGGDSDGYAIIPAVSYGLSAVARILEPQLQTGDNVLIVEEEFPSSVLTWRRVAKEKNINLITVPKPANGNWTEGIINKIDKSVKVVSISTCHWTNGALIDLISIRKICDLTGSLMVIDATQSLGAMPFAMDEIRPDFLIAAGYKWLLSPYGFTLMYVSERWRNSRPLEESWQARENAEDFTSLVNYSDTYMVGARRFDVGEKGTPTILPGALAALKQIKEWGVPQISETLSVINKRIAAQLVNLGFQLPDDSQRCPHMLGAVIPERYKGNLVSELREKKIFISQRGKSVRFAPHLYITDNDLFRLLETLNDLMI